MPPSRSSRTGSARPSVGPSSSSARGTPARKGGGRPGGARTSAAAAAAAAAALSSRSDLPAYEQPLAPLTASGQHQLRVLGLQHDLSSLQGRLQDAHERLAGAAADMAEMKTRRVEVAGVRAARQRERGLEGDAEDDARLADLVRRVDDTTAAIEREVRRTVDREARVNDSEEALRELSANGQQQQRAPRHRRAHPMPTQATNNQTQSEFGAPTETQMTDGAAADDDENEAEVPAVSLLEALRTKLKDAETKYEALTMRERYSAHNSYVAFRKMLHSAQYSDDAAAPPVPHASSWFDEASGEVRQLKPHEESEDPASGTGTQSMLPPPLPSQSGTQGPGGEGDDSESDIEAVAERTSIKCPLTLQPMAQPVSSRKCPHSFERAAILEYLSSGSTATGRRGAARAAPCPVCEVVLTQADLHIDRVLQRRIRRIQEAEARRREAEDEEDDDDEERRARRGPQAQLIGSSSPLRSSAAPPRSGRAAAMKVKAERMSGVSTRRREEAMDVDGDEDDDD